jgi:hypothetical protein
LTLFGYFCLLQFIGGVVSINIVVLELKKIIEKKSHDITHFIYD